MADNHQEARIDELNEKVSVLQEVLREIVDSLEVFSGLRRRGENEEPVHVPGGAVNANKKDDVPLRLVGLGAVLPELRRKLARASD